MENFKKENILQDKREKSEQQKVNLSPVRRLLAWELSTATGYLQGRQREGHSLRRESTKILGSEVRNMQLRSVFIYLGTELAGCKSRRNDHRPLGHLDQAYPQVSSAFHSSTGLCNVRSQIKIASYSLCFTFLVCMNSSQMHVSVTADADQHPCVGPIKKIPHSWAALPPDTHRGAGSFPGSSWAKQTSGSGIWRHAGFASVSAQRE